LSTTAGAVPKFVKEETQESRIISFTNLEEDTAFVQWLNQSKEVFFDKVKELTPSQLDMEIRQYPLQKMNLLLSAIKAGIHSKRDFEFYQSLLHRILKVQFFDLDSQFRPKVERE
jgi:hypothetical protein